MDKINKLIDINKYYIFYKNKIILTADNLKELKKSVKENIEIPSKNLKVYILDFSIKSNYKNVFSIICSQYTITPKLALVMKDDDMSQTINYTQNELDKYGFNKSHLTKIINAIKKNLISYEKSSVSISDILD